MFLLASALLASTFGVLAAGPAAAEPRFTPGPCFFTIPEGESALCGTVAVPDRRDAEATRAFRLPVVVLLSTAADPAPDPVLFLEGGPGASPFGSGEAVEERMEGWWLQTDALRRQRNVILFDPRGAGRAEPDTDCPELDVLGATPRPRPPTRAERAALEREAILACAERFKANGLDSALFTSPIAADDALDVAAALGAQRVNLFAVSYGTRVALSILRRQGARVRSAVLDAVYPPDVNALEEAPWLAQRAFRRLFEDCAASRACRAASPDLEKRFLARVAALEDRPAVVQIGDPDIPQAVDLDAAAALSAALEAMAAGEPVPRLPRILDRAAQGRLERLAVWAPPPWIGDPDTADGLAFSIECRETVNAADPARLEANARRHAPYGAVNADEPGRRVCADWPASRPEPAELLPVASPVPVLLLSGAYDPVTPPDWADRAAATLPKSRHIVFRSAGHTVTATEECAMTAVAAFIAAPDALPEGICPEAARAPRFLGP
ncbi:alpha/beta hydrolase [Azospirillum sp. SYSU D00513]|uniref:alpha/beta hydrolase n=1 Tax=Azospirillum sp. SYSU D00513 TaxID=2812561 RepID=UPI001FFF4087|nr:alpha/beta hydrolase [Azospirillum sp. SYSU D00513]